MFVGERRGDEDIPGKLFVGRVAQLPTDIIKAMKLTRHDVYSAKVMKCAGLRRTAIPHPTSMGCPEAPIYVEVAGLVLRRRHRTIGGREFKK